MSSNENRPYSLLAKFYDELIPTGDMNHHARAKMLDGLMEGIDSACDLACGSGRTALNLARSVQRIFAVDNSPEFCRTVRARARENGLRIKVLRADMRNFRLPETVDLVTCEQAALNNLANRRDLGKVFRAVHRAVRPGGYFLFDVNTALSFREQVSGGHWQQSPRFLLAMHASTIEDGLQCRLDLEWFLPRGKLWSHQQETIFHVAWMDREIQQALRAAGFNKPLLRDGMDVRPPGFCAKRGYDVYYLARKPLK